MDINQKVFLALVRLGLWTDAESKDLGILGLSELVDWEDVYRLVSEQSVLGLVLAGIDNFNVRPPKELLLQWIGEVQMLEQQNKQMNGFISELFEKISKAGINTILVKGQGVAQCYEKPLWRCCGDIDLLMDGENYERAKEFLIPIAAHVEMEDVGKKHLGLYIKDFLVELHGAMPFELSRRVNGVVDEIIEMANTDNTNGANDLKGVAIPKADEHVMIVFTHYLNHFFIEGVGLRQICDWSRLLWSYRTTLNFELLETRIKKAGLMSEWQVFGTLAVDYLGMPAESMPFYKDSKYMRRQAGRVFARLVKSGNFGHNNDLSYRSKYTGLMYKLVAVWRRMLDFVEMSVVFPEDGPRFFVSYVINKIKGDYS